MADPSKMLAEFHGALGDKPGRGDSKLREKLITEEWAEVVEALIECREAEDSDAFFDAKAHLARELADLVYVVYGTAHAFDLDLDVAVAEVHRAAMSKIVRTNGEPPLVRADGKILKPPEFVPPDTAKAVRG